MGDDRVVRNDIEGALVGSVVQAGTIAGDLHVHQPQRMVVIPRQLPAAPRLFEGRANEVAKLSELLIEKTNTHGVALISGIGGIGKTALALHWAHQHISHFPDGQLYVNLRGFDPSGEPVTPAAAVRGFLDALAVDPAVISVSIDAQAALYRSLVAGKRMLVVLDNAASTAQIEQLLPGGPSCTVVVTSRRRLTDLYLLGAHMLDLDVLPPEKARQLLSLHIGQKRVEAEPDAANEILQHSAGLPLAISILAARAATRPTFSLAVLTAELRNTSTRLDALGIGDQTANLRTVLSWSYRALDAPHSRLFRLLGLAPGSDIGLHAASSLSAQPIAETQSLLQELETVHLVQQHIPGRYRMHDLVRLYAVERADHDEPSHERISGLRRLVGFYLHTADAGDALLYPHRRSVKVDRPTTGCTPFQLKSIADALMWFETEHRCVMATIRLAEQQNWHVSVWHLTRTLTGFHLRRGHLQENLTVWRAGLKSAKHLNDPIVHSWAHRGLGSILSRFASHTDAVAHLTQALIIAEHAHDVFGQASTHRVFAWVWSEQGDYQRALHHSEVSLQLYQSLNRPVQEAEARTLVGKFKAQLGRYTTAQSYCESALVLHQRHNHGYGEAQTLDCLGDIAQRTGRHADAINHYRRTIHVRREIGDSYAEASTLSRLGDSHAALSQHADAYDCWQQALSLYDIQRRESDSDEARNKLASLKQSGH